MRDKIERQEPGGRRDDTCDRGLSRNWKIDVYVKKKRVTQKCHECFDNMSRFLTFEVQKSHVRRRKKTHFLYARKISWHVINLYGTCRKRFKVWIPDKSY